MKYTCWHQTGFGWGARGGYVGKILMMVNSMYVLGVRKRGDEYLTSYMF